jgi:hypothetical protein
VTSLETADGETVPRMTCGRFGIAGFPFAFDATCTEATVTYGDQTVTLAGFQTSILVFNPFHVLAFAQGPATYDDTFGGSRRRIDFADAQASARLTGWRIGRVSVIANDIVVTDTVVEDRPMGDAKRLEVHLVDEPGKHDASAGVATLAQRVAITGLNWPGFGIAGGNATLDAEITSLPDDVRTYGEGDLLRRWQGAGGRYQITSLQGEDDDTSFDTTGTLGLDGNGRVEGQIRTTSRGIVEQVQGEIGQPLPGFVVGAQAEDGSYSQTFNILAGIVVAGLLPVGAIPLEPLW